MSRPFAGLVLAAAFTVAGCASTAEKPPEPTDLVRIDSPAAEAETLWSRGAGAGFEKEPAGFRLAVGGDRVFTADDKGQVFAYTREAGKRLWKSKLDLEVVSGPSVIGDLVVVGTREAEVIALDANDGSQRWLARVSGEVLAPAAGDQGVVVVRSFDGFVYGLDAVSGQRLWAVDRTVPTLTLRGIGAPLIVQGKVLVGTDGGKILAVGLHDGIPEWESTVSIPSGRSELERLVDVDANLLSDGSVVYAASYAGDLVALDLGKGDTQWTQKIASLKGMAVSGERLFISDPECRVFAVDRNSGELLWKREELRYRECSQPAVHRGLVAIGDLDGYIHWLAPEDGRILVRDRAVSDPIAPPVIVDEKLLILSENGKLVALDLVKN